MGSYLLCIASLHLRSIQPLRQLKSTTLILVKPMLVDTELTKTPTVTWSRKWSSKINVSHTLKQRAGLKMKKTVCQWNITTAQVSSKQTSNVCVLMSMNWSVTWLKLFITTLEETYQVQRCFTGKDRVCDTTYKIDMTTKDDYQCT